MRKLFTILAVSYLFSACSKKMHPAVQTVIKDSIITRTETKYRDTVIEVPGREVFIRDTLIDCPDAVLNRSETRDGITAKATISKGRLQVQCKADSLQLVIRYLQDRLTFTERFKTETITVEKPVEVTRYKIPGWIWWVLIISLALNIWEYRHGIIAFIQTVFWKLKR